VAYESFGAVSSSSGTGDRFLYTAREYDSVAKLQNNRNRYYDAVIGRWNEQDPIGFAGDDANLYRYVGNAPAAFFDPAGLEMYLKPVDVHGYGNHYELLVYDPVTGTGYVFSGGGAGISGAFGTGGEAEERAPREMYPSELPQRNDKLIRLPYNDSYEDQLRKLLESSRRTSQIPAYNAAQGPNSNTYLNQLLKNAGYSVPPPPRAPGWEYKGVCGYGGDYWNTYGKPYLVLPWWLIPPPFPFSPPVWPFDLPPGTF
jgi:RHS repeat-associated protein